MEGIGMNVRQFISGLEKTTAEYRSETDRLANEFREGCMNLIAEFMGEETVAKPRKVREPDNEWHEYGS